MTRFISRILGCSILLCLNVELKSQNNDDLFSIENSKIYAEHLFKTKEYYNASNLYITLWKLSNRVEFALKTAQCYRALGDYELNREFLLSTGPIKDDKFEFDVMTLITKHHNPTYFSESTYGKDTFEALIESELLFQNKFSAAIKYSNHYNSSYIPKKEWESTLSLAKKYKPLSPILAGTLSTIIPGMGKIYSGRTIDGIMGFVSVASFGYLAYEGFRYKKYKSIAAWIYAPFAVGFYIGNIYGSTKSAKVRNIEKQHQIHEKTQKILLNHLL